MIEASSPICEEVVTGEGLYLSQAARLLPPCREGRPTHPSTLHRWAMRGVKLPTGETLYLETTRISGKLLTTRGALKRFLAAQAIGTPQAAPAIRTPARRQREHRAAAELLATKYRI